MSYGANRLKPPKQPDLALLLVQFKNPIVLTLIFAAGLSFVHDVLPTSAWRAGRVAGFPVHAGQMQAEGRRFLGFVPGGDKAESLVFVRRVLRVVCCYLVTRSSQ